MNEIDTAANELARLLRTSNEYREFKAAEDAACADAATKAMLGSYRKLQLRIQAAELAGGAAEDDLTTLQHVGELLQMNPLTSEYLFAQYRLNSLLGRIYRKLAEAVEADLSMIDG